MSKASGRSDADSSNGIGLVGLSPEAAIASARAGTLPMVELMQIAEGLSANGLTDKSIELYRTWIESNQSPLMQIACFNLGVTFSGIRNYVEARKWYEKALEYAPDFIQAHLNLGTCYEQLKDTEKAIAQWREALNLPVIGKAENRQLKVHALNNLGRLLETLKRYDEALIVLEESLSVDRSQKDVVLHLIHLRQRQCLWPVYKPLPNVSKQYLKDWTSPLAMLAESDEPERQLAAAKAFVAHKYADKVEELAGVGGYGHDRIRIGYLSSDFSLHPVSMLTVELFERHDRSRFEVYGFCWSPEDGSGLRARVIGAMDHFIKIGHLSDEEAAKAIRGSEIDIIIDLQGLTSGARPYILAHRPAPVQITYLGFPGTTGLPWLDYVICDDYIIPKEGEQFFTEKPLRMEKCFQVSDSKRAVGPTPARAANGLPEDSFVFCAFNNNYKYTQQMFDSWMTILARVPDSVLWLLADNIWAKENMIKAAGKRGVSAERLIFAPRVSPQDYLARYLIADLFLDTYPFNGGTTANDALWMGLPLLTLSGKTFASRMAGSLLNNLGLGEMVTHTFDDYIKKAIHFGKNRSNIEEIKAKLAVAKNESHVFDMESAVRDYEALVSSVVSDKPVLKIPVVEVVDSVPPAACALSPEKSDAPGDDAVKEPSLAVVSIQRDRGPWIVEWLAFHMLAGFNNFFIYAHKCSDDMTQKLLRLSLKYPITVFTVTSDDRPQLKCYQHAYDNFGASMDWLAFIDGDEFLFSPGNENIGDALRKYEDKELSALAAFWVCYGSSGHLDEPKGLVVENYTRHSCYDFLPNRHVKSIVKGRQQGVVVSGSHLFQTPKGTFDEDLRPIRQGWMKDYPPTYREFRISHYAVQSYEYFCKFKKASGAPDFDPNFIRKDSWFVDYDRNECDDGAMYNFLIRLKLKVRELNAAIEAG